MFMVLGILSILAGIFVFRQGSALSILSGFAGSQEASAISGAFLIVAICMVLAGIFACACKSGEKRGFVKTSAVVYFLGAFFGFVFNTGDLKIWAIVCLALGILYIAWLTRHKKEA